MWQLSANVLDISSMEYKDMLSALRKYRDFLNNYGKDIEENPWKNTNISMRSFDIQNAVMIQLDQLEPVLFGMSAIADILAEDYGTTGSFSWDSFYDVAALASCLSFIQALRKKQELSLGNMIPSYADRPGDISREEMIGQLLCEGSYERNWLTSDGHQRAKSASRYIQSYLSDLRQLLNDAAAYAVAQIFSVDCRTDKIRLTDAYSFWAEHGERLCTLQHNWTGVLSVLSSANLVEQDFCDAASRENTIGQLQKEQASLENALQLIGDFNRFYGTDLPPYNDSFDQIDDAIAIMENPNMIRTAWVKNGQLGLLKSRVADASALLMKINSSKSQLLQDWLGDFLAFDSAGIYDEFKNALQLIGDFNKACGTDLHLSDCPFDQMGDAITVTANPNMIRTAWVKNGQFGLLKSRVADASALLVKINSSKFQLLQDWREDFLAFDPSGVYDKFKNEYTSFFKRLGSAYKNDKKLLVSMRRTQDKKLQDVECIAGMDLLKDYQSTLEAYTTEATALAKILPGYIDGLDTDWGHIAEVLDSCDAIERYANTYGVTEAMSATLEASPSERMAMVIGQKTVAELAEEHVLYFERIGSTYKNDKNLLTSMRRTQDKKLQDAECIAGMDLLKNYQRALEAYTTEVTAFAEILPGYIGGLDTDWGRIADVLDSCDAVEHYMNTYGMSDAMSATLEVSPSERMAIIIGKNTIAEFVDSRLLEQVRASLRSLGNKRFNIQLEYVNKRIQAVERANALCEETNRFIARAAALGGIGILGNVRPEVLIDMVIFDEASQILPEDAIGAIYRGKQVIIAGDTKQMPPTNFFSAASRNNDDLYDDEDEYTSYIDIVNESILDEANTYLPTCTLLWHYRSKDESLIAFSNDRIYNSKLITFPNSDIIPDRGVEYVYVRDGFYEGGGKNCNVREAVRCVQLVAEHIKNHPDRSLGIIAFSEKQQELLYKRLATVFGNKKATAPVRRTIDDALKRMSEEITIKKDFVYLVNSGEIKPRKPKSEDDVRAIEYICPEEIQSALTMIVEFAFGLTLSDLISETARAFGFARTGAKIKQVITENYEQMLADDRLKEVDGKIYLQEGI